MLGRSARDRDVGDVLMTRTKLRNADTAVNRNFLLRIITIGTFISAPLLVGSCGGKASKGKVSTTPASSVVIGSCAAPETTGVLSAKPKIVSAAIDLNGDGQTDPVFSDRSLCKGDNCYWNLFSRMRGCERYVGTIEGKSLELLQTASTEGFRDILAWWELPGKERQLRQRYRFIEGGYRLLDVMVCREDPDNGLLCAEEEFAND